MPSVYHPFRLTKLQLLLSMYSRSTFWSNIIKYWKIMYNNFWETAISHKTKTLPKSPAVSYKIIYGHSPTIMSISRKLKMSKKT